MRFAIMSAPVGYSVSAYGNMINCATRAKAYAAALQATVRVGSSVTDIGAGTGIFSLLACQFGAARVHAVEPNDALLVARASAAANSFADRITFLDGLSTDLALELPADVIVSDLRGVLPLLQSHIAVIADARRRLLAPGGALIPGRDHLFAALVHDPKLHLGHTEPWLANDFGLDLTAGHPFVVNSWCRASAEAEQLLVEPQRWGTLDYYTVEDPNVAGSVAWTVERPGTAHGLLLWFDAELAPGIGFSNAPGQPKLIYGQGFFPLETAVELAPGDRVAVDIRADLVDGEYVWSWRTRVDAADGGHPKAEFRQSTFKSQPVSAAALARRAAGHVPAVTPSLELDRFCLERIDGRTSHETIARALAERFPDRFQQWTAALNHVVRLAERYAGPG
jgi:type I protein arginine methyltransferase